MVLLYSVVVMVLLFCVGEWCCYNGVVVWCYFFIIIAVFSLLFFILYPTFQKSK